MIRAVNDEGDGESRLNANDKKNKYVFDICTEDGKKVGANQMWRGVNISPSAVYDWNGIEKMLNRIEQWTPEKAKERRFNVLYATKEYKDRWSKIDFEYPETEFYDIPAYRIENLMADESISEEKAIKEIIEENLDSDHGRKDENVMSEDNEFLSMCDEEDWWYSIELLSYKEVGGGKAHWVNKKRKFEEVYDDEEDKED